MLHLYFGKSNALKWSIDKFVDAIVTVDWLWLARTISSQQLTVNDTPSIKLTRVLIYFNIIKNIIWSYIWPKSWLRFNTGFNSSCQVRWPPVRSYARPVNGFICSLSNSRIPSVNRVSKRFIKLHLSESKRLSTNSVTISACSDIFPMLGTGNGGPASVVVSFKTNNEQCWSDVT